MTLGEKLKKERKKYGYLVKEVAEITKIPAVTITSYENDLVKNIPHKNLILLSNLYFREPSYFISSNYEREIDKKLKKTFINTLECTLKDLDILEQEDLNELIFNVTEKLK